MKFDVKEGEMFLDIQEPDEFVKEFYGEDVRMVIGQKTNGRVHYSTTILSRHNAERLFRAANGNKAMLESLKECEATICRLCKVINPQHADCSWCDEIGKLQVVIADNSPRN